MLEYYESAKHLNISSNQGIGIYGWQACANMIRKVYIIYIFYLKNSTWLLLACEYYFLLFYYLSCIGRLYRTTELEMALNIKCLKLSFMFF